MNGSRKIRINPLSGTSLFLEIVHNNQIIGSATGFIIELNNTHYLVTNWHVVSGGHTATNQPSLQEGITPTHLNIIYHSSTRLGAWIKKTENLLNQDGTLKWLEHQHGRNIDVILLPLRNIDNEIQIYPFDLNLVNTDIIPEPAMPVSIIGYPLGIVTGGNFPIWKTGHIASDPDLDYNNLPVFLIDATTRGGMSGSPVVLRLSGNYTTRSGERILSGDTRTLFLGIYSGRIQRDSEIGMVWRPVVINEIANNAGII
jgi:hypothetical protein